MKAILQVKVPRNWSISRKIIFRFLCIYFLLFTTPWTWLGSIPVIQDITQYYYDFENWLVTVFNNYIFHVKEVLVPMGGSGDTSFGWAQLFTYFLVALLGCIIWSILDRKRSNYNILAFWLRNIVRYTILTISFSYGIIKLFALQMPFPNLSQLATPLGDFLPMRLSWMFIGYSSSYQFFSGLMEILVAVLLFNRKTVTFGALVGVGVFSNVVMLNLSYDIPVKIFSLQLLACCLFLLVSDWKRVINFLILNKPATANGLYQIQFDKKWQKISRLALKLLVLILFIIIPIKDSWNWYKESLITKNLKPIEQGVYNLETFVRNNDTIPVLAANPEQWKDIIFQNNGTGSINTTDSLFRQRYGRGYFSYKPDTVSKTIVFLKRSYDSIPIFTAKYRIKNDSVILLWTEIRRDSIYLELQKSKRHFQLAERQFHWISESNR